MIGQRFDRGGKDGITGWLGPFVRRVKDFLLEGFFRLVG